MTAPGVVRWRRKPEPPPDREVQVAVQWLPPQPLDGLLYVARMADGDAQLAVATFGSVGVLVVQYRQHYAERAATTEYLTVTPGRWLAYDPGAGTLYSSHDGNWAAWYDQVP